MRLYLGSHRALRSAAACARQPAKMAAEWTGAKVRSSFIEFFKSKGHSFWPSSSVVPLNDPTLLFANAGMNQYKPIFLGTVDPNSDLAKLTRACNSQKCIRAGGKHNDLDDVGKDNYHHTFFEMLGNWSFGDYFKEEAICWAFELLTEVYKLSPDRLYATYFGGDDTLGLPADTEARDIWLKFLPPERVLPYGCKDNFWEMGEQGPCGPSTEIHYDRIGGRDASSLVNQDDPNVLEIWNLVFIQFNREADGNLKQLPLKHVDTGAGLERVTSILQGKMSNYATDIFGQYSFKKIDTILSFSKSHPLSSHAVPLFDAIQKATGHPEPYTDRLGAEDTNNKDMAYRVVADHIRTLCFAIADGSRPGNEGREYVLRRVLRRGVRYGREVLGAPEGFFSSLVDAVIDCMGEVFPELVKNRDRIVEILREEEASFSRTLVKGLERFKKMAGAAKNGRLSGQDAFILWDTFGFPIDLTQLMAEESGLAVDMDGFAKALEDAKELSRASAKKGGADGLKFEAEATAWLASHDIGVTDDSYKYVQENIHAKVVAILTKSGFVQSSSEAEHEGPVGIVLDRTPFYAEAGGQVADTGLLQRMGSNGSNAGFSVEDAIVAAGYVLHVGKNPGADSPLRVGDEVSACVDYERRSKIMPNHTFTHVLNFALREVLGDHVEQKGSIVLPERLRFDFTNNGPVETKSLKAVEDICKKFVSQQTNVYAEEVPLNSARDIHGLRAVFGEVYPDPVRVVSVGKPVEELLQDPESAENAKYPIEFCGGTHLSNTRDAGNFALLTEEGIAKGIRRIVAVTGTEATSAIAMADELAARVAAAKAKPPAEISGEATELKIAIDKAPIPAVRKAELRAEVQGLIKAVMEEQKKAAAANREKAVKAAVDAAEDAVGTGKSFFVTRVPDVGLDAKALQEAYNAIQKKHAGMSVMFFAEGDGKALAWAGVGKEASTKLPAGEWVKAALQPLNGRGGGKPTCAQGQGPNLSGMDEALKIAEEMAQLKLSN